MPMLVSNSGLSLSEKLRMLGKGASINWWPPLQALSTACIFVCEWLSKFRKMAGKGRFF
jgi:hypothetical protein